MTRQRHRPVLLNAANLRVLEGHSRFPAPPAGWGIHALLSSVIGIFLVAGLALAAQLPESWHTWSRLNAEGIETTAVVTSRHTVGVRNTSYYLTYRFDARDGAAYSHRSRVRRSTYYAYPPGGSLTVRYVPADPELSTPVPGDSPLTDTLFLVLMDMGGLVALLLVARPFGFAWRYARHGRLLTGEVASTSTRVVNERRILVVRYRFRNPAAQVLEGKATQRLGTEGEPAPGTELAIAYVDDRHHRAL